MTRRVEQQIQRAVLGHLAWRALPDIWWAHYPAGGWRSVTEAAILKSLGVAAGVPDILIVHRGQLYGLELKAEDGRLTDVQTAMHEKMKRAGAIVATAYGVDAALEQLAAWGLLRPDVSTQAVKKTFVQPSEEQIGRNHMKFTIKVEAFKPLRRNTLIGFASINVVELHLNIIDLAVHENRGKRWCSLPAKPWIDRDGVVKRDENGKIIYAPVLEFTNRETRDAFSARVIEALLEFNPGAFDGEVVA